MKPTALALFALLVICSCAATPSQVQGGVNTTIDLTTAVCNVAEGQPAGQPYVDIVCAIAQGVEQTVSVIVGATNASGAPTTSTMSVPVQQIRIRMPAPTAKAFLAAHGGGGK